MACERPAVAPSGDRQSEERVVVRHVAPRANANEPLKVVIDPEQPSADTDLTALANDAAVTYAWSVNGFPVEGVSDRVLPKNRFRRSDRVAVEVALNGQTAQAEAIINNALPRAVEVVLDRPVDSLHAGTDLTAMPRGVDPDGDDIQWEYQWLRNDEEIPGEAGAVLAADRYRRGDRVTVRVTPSDAEGQGEPYTPQAATVLNAAPTFVSRAPAWSGGVEYVYQVHALDPDGDPVQYQLTKAPGGMVVDPSTGMIRWPLVGAPPGRHAIEIQINDGQGATASQPFELELAPPEGT
jgi:hypothetical protein